MVTPWVGFNIQAGGRFREAVVPLLEAGDVDVLEYSFDMGWDGSSPDWLLALTDYYAAQGRLLGHGVNYSTLSAEGGPLQAEWLRRFNTEITARPYLHISEHFGFMNSGNFHQNAPLPVPRNAAALRLGHERLRALTDLFGGPVGLENLAFAFGPADVREQGPFLDELLAPVDGFVLLDLHNLHCQVCNFDVPFDELLNAYPLHRVRELHVAGGSWSEHMGKRMRRDTHDDAVPEELFGYVSKTLQRCPNVRAVIFEVMSECLTTDRQVADLRADFARLRATVQEARP